MVAGGSNDHVVTQSQNPRRSWWPSSVDLADFFYFRKLLVEVGKGPVSINTELTQALYHRL